MQPHFKKEKNNFFLFIFMNYRKSVWYNDIDSREKRLLKSALGANISKEEGKMIKRFVMEEEGQTLREYGLLISLIALVVIAVLTVMGNKIKNTFNAAGNQMTS
jgi:pilus assembly protein Flp/PilA